MRETTPSAVGARLAAGALLVDVREPHEWQAGHAAAAVSMPLSSFDPAALPDAALASRPVLRPTDGQRRGHRCGGPVPAGSHVAVPDDRHAAGAWLLGAGERGRPGLRRA